jgi:RHS repeat-associated protein
LINLVVNDNPIPSKLYQATTITSSGKVLNSSNVTFTAAQSIDLTTGFEANPTFFANIDATPIAPTPTTTTQDYTGGIEYKNNVLEAMYHAEGRAYKNPTSWQYEYTLKDHLGNSRVTFRDNNGTAEILQENHYYPFGLNQEGKWLNNTALPDTKYQYNGKELNEDLGLNWNDYGARWYDAAIGRWNTTDPLSEKYGRWSPYNYTMNNPIRFIDPDGMGVAGDYYNWQGEYLGKDNKDDQKVYVADKLENGNFINAKDLGITHSDFREIVGTVYSEMHKTAYTWHEGAAITDVLENRGKASKTDILTEARDGGVYGHKHWQRIDNISSVDKNKLSVTVSEVINAMLNTNTDYSNGATYWQGTDFADKNDKNSTAYADFYDVGFKFSDKNHDHFNLGDNIKSSSQIFGNLEKSWDYKYESTAFYGRTTFMKKTDEFKKAQFFKDDTYAKKNPY